MRRFLLDTGSANDYIDHRGGVYPKAQQQKQQGHVIGSCVPVLGELWSGVELSSAPLRRRALLIRSRSSWKVWPCTEAAAAEFGRIFAHLKRTGRPMQQIDIQIAAIALTLGSCTVVTKDSDFKAIPGLAVEDWSVP
jgi:tRNA(fMet)-specific endonuclease VapC